MTILRADSSVVELPLFQGEDGGAIPTSALQLKSFSDLLVREIPYRLAMDVIVKNHYLHRECPCSIAFGLFVDSKNNHGLIDSNKLVGVIVFGKPSSYTLCNGICGKDESSNVIEFNRLWVNDSMPKNTESFFVSKAIKKCPYQIIVSFADSEQGHIGYIYQATNWIYTGISPKMKYFRLKIKSDNNGGTAYRRRERMTRKKILDQYGEDMVEEYFSSMKYRYVYFNCSKSRKCELLKKFKYKPLPYPKNLEIVEKQKGN